MSDVLPVSRSLLPLLVRALKRGAVIVYPTDTVYGLGCDATNSPAVRRLLRMKRRKTKPPPLLVFDLAMAQKYAVMDGATKRMLQQLWPGALTVVLPARQDRKDMLPYQKGSIGLRIPNHPFLLELLHALKRPLIGTSANETGKPPAKTVRDVVTAFKNNPPRLRPDFFIDGGVLLGRSSTVVDLTERRPNIIRRGPVTKRDIFRALRSTPSRR